MVSLVVDGNEVVGANSIPGLTMAAEQRLGRAKARVTIEFGTVDMKHLGTHMAPGVDEEAAVNVIVRGMLGH